MSSKCFAMHDKVQQLPYRMVHLAGSNMSALACLVCMTCYHCAGLQFDADMNEDMGIWRLAWNPNLLTCRRFVSAPPDGSIRNTGAWSWSFRTILASRQSPFPRFWFGHTAPFPRAWKAQVHLFCFASKYGVLSWIIWKLRIVSLNLFLCWQRASEAEILPDFCLPPRRWNLGEHHHSARGPGDKSDVQADPLKGSHWSDIFNLTTF